MKSLEALVDLATSINMPTPFSPTKAMGIAPKEYNQYWDEPTMVKPEVGAAPMMLSQGNAFTDQFDEFETANKLNGLDARKEVLAGGVDWGDLGKRREMLFAGGISPTEEGRIAAQESLLQRQEAAQAKALADMQYEQQAGTLLKELQGLDPADPEHELYLNDTVRRHPVSKKALSDPRIAALIRSQQRENEEMQKLFSEDPDARAEYSVLRKENPAVAKDLVRSNSQRRAIREEFAKQGINPDEFDAGKFNDANGRPDKAKMAFHIAQSKKEEKDATKNAEKGLGSTDLKALEEASSALTSKLETDDKVAAFKAKYGKPPAPDSAEEWKEAFHLMTQSAAPEVQKLKLLIDNFRKSKKAIPDEYAALVGESGAPQSKTEARTGDVTISPQESAPANETPAQRYLREARERTKLK